MKEVVLKYDGKVEEDGKIVIPKKFKREVQRAFIGKSIEVTVRRKKRRRSTAQNAYYWGVVIEHLQAILTDFDPTQKLTPASVHEWAKDKWLPVVLGEAPTIETPEGTETARYTTTSITTSQFMDFIALAQQWAAEWAGVVIPDPHTWPTDGEIKF